MKILTLLAGGALVLGANPLVAQPQTSSAQSSGQNPCPMAGRGMGSGMMSAGMSGRAGMANMQQMHGDMEAMRSQMTAMRSEMQAMHQEMMKLRQSMPHQH